MIDHLIEGKLSKNQYGFTKNQSTVTNLMSCYNKLYNILNKKKSATLIIKETRIGFLPILKR